MSIQRAILLLLCFAGCPGPGAKSEGPGPSLGPDSEPGSPSSSPQSDGGELDAGAPDAVFKAVDAIGETEARSILADVFRGAGYRILYDVMISDTIALDGFDPRKKVGYEYVAIDDSSAPSGLETVGQVLVLGPSSREKIIEQAKAFVKELAARTP